MSLKRFRESARAPVHGERLRGWLRVEDRVWGLCGALNHGGDDGDDDDFHFTLLAILYWILEDFTGSLLGSHFLSLQWFEQPETVNT